jgi:hypothetical protein
MASSHLTFFVPKLCSAPYGWGTLLRGWTVRETARKRCKEPYKYFYDPK